MTTDSSTIIVIGGPNGSGKSTIAPALIGEYLGVESFVNADTIARGLSEFDPQRVTFEAGRIMLTELKRLSVAHESFAFESTLASRTFATWIRRLIDTMGYEFVLAYIWVRNPDLAVERVAARVRAGGHDVPEEVIRRRWSRSTHNLWNLYLPLAHRWCIYDNSDGVSAERVAEGGLEHTERILNARTWEQMRYIP